MSSTGAHVTVTGLDDAQTQLTRDRALREARLAAQLRGHPHVVAGYDVLVDDGDIWLVMEYLPARSLGEIMAAQISGLPCWKEEATVADMETYSSSGPDPAAARSALDDVASARGRVADRVGSPWWYRVALGLSMALTFVALGVGGNVTILGAVIGGIAVPTVLTWAANRSTGVSLDRYRSGTAAAYVIGLFVLMGAGLWVRSGLDVSWAMVVAGIGALLLILVMEPRIDAAVRRDLRTTR